MSFVGGEPIGIGCYACSPAQQSSVNGIYNPWQNDFVVTNQARPLGTPETNTSRTDSFQGWRLLTTEPRRFSYRRQLDIRPLGTIIYPEGEPPPNASQINGGFKYCPTRVRVTWSENPFTHAVEISVGPGITFSLPPAGQVTVDWLVPNPATNADVRVPDNFNVNGSRFATTLIAKSSLVSSPTPVRPTLTQTVFVSGALAVAGGAGHQLFVPNGARTLQVFSSVAFGNVAVPATTDTVVTFTQEYITLPVDAAVPAPFNTFPTETVPFVDPFTTGRVVAPTGYNVVRVNANTNPDIRRNVTLVWELDV